MPLDVIPEKQQALVAPQLLPLRSFHLHLGKTAALALCQNSKPPLLPVHILLSFSEQMTVLLLLVLILASTGVSDASWCVCRTDVSDAALQKALDYACGAGADCTPILQNGPCFQPNTVRSHCSYAANSYFQKKGQAAGTCDFAGTATVSTTDPSSGSCSYPSTAGTAGPVPTAPAGPVPAAPGTPVTNPVVPSPPATPFSPTPTTPTTTPPGNFPPSITTPPGNFPPSTTTPPGTFPPSTPSPGGGILGGGAGLGPSGSSFNTDGNNGGTLSKAWTGSLIMAMMLSSVVILRG